MAGFEPCLNLLGVDLYMSSGVFEIGNDNFTCIIFYVPAERHINDIQTTVCANCIDIDSAVRIGCTGISDTETHTNNRPESDSADDLFTVIRRTTWIKD